MFVATNRLTIQSGHGDDLEERFRKQGGVEHQAGFLGFEFWKLNQEAETEEYLVVTHWDSKDAHDQWTHSDEFRQAHAGERPAYLLGGDFQTYDVRISSGPEGKKS